MHLKCKLSRTSSSASRLNLATGARAMSANRVLTPSRIVVALQAANQRHVGGQAGHFQAVEVAGSGDDDEAAIPLLNGFTAPGG